MREEPQPLSGRATSWSLGMKGGVCMALGGWVVIQSGAESGSPGRRRQIFAVEGPLHCSPGLRNPFLRENVPEAHLHAGTHSAQGIMSCGGDGRPEPSPLASPTEAGTLKHRRHSRTPLP